MMLGTAEEMSRPDDASAIRFSSSSVPVAGSEVDSTSAKLLADGMALLATGKLCTCCLGLNPSNAR